jgi:hypothetical protein
MGKLQYPCRELDTCPHQMVLGAQRPNVKSVNVSSSLNCNTRASPISYFLDDGHKMVTLDYIVSSRNADASSVEQLPCAIPASSA